MHPLAHVSGLNCTHELEISIVATWTMRVILFFLIIIQLTGNSTMIWILVRRTKLTKGNAFILSLAVSDLISGIGSIPGAYGEDLGLLVYNWPTGDFLNTGSALKFC